jgi:protein gp37
MGWSKKPWTAQNAAENVVLRPERLEIPLHWKKPKRVFVDSMSDLFHEQVTDYFILNVFGVMERSQRHVFQVLTKRPQRMLEWVNDYDHWLRYSTGSGFADFHPNVWLGVSVENQRAADERIPLLLQTPTAMRFVSCEPLLGEVDISLFLHAWHSTSYDTPPIDWVICGGESGANYRPMDLAWLLFIVEQCKAAGVPIFVKQDSGRYPGKQGRIPDELWKLKEYPS